MYGVHSGNQPHSDVYLPADLYYEILTQYQ